MAVADVYDTLRSKRPYRKSLTHKEAYDIIVGESGKHFDPIIVEAFQKVADKLEETTTRLNKDADRW
jgi:putative two-component system response regulator